MLTQFSWAFRRRKKSVGRSRCVTHLFRDWSL